MEYVEYIGEYVRVVFLGLFLESMANSCIDIECDFREGDEGNSSETMGMCKVSVGYI